MKRFLMVIVIVILLGFMFFRTYASGKKQIELSSDIKLEIPNFSILLKERENIVRFQNFRSYNNIQSEWNNILKTYEIISCNNKDYYYNKNQNYTIIDYEIHDYKIFNSIYLKYENGNYCERNEKED